MISDATLYIHGTGASAFGPITNNGGVLGDSCCYAGSQYSNLEVDLGAPGSASSYPYVSQFPSYTEEGYNAAGKSQAETFDTGVPFGLHIAVGQAFNTLTSITFGACSSAATSATSTYEIATRTLTLAQLQQAGAHYFIPVNLSQVLEFNNFYASLSGGSPTSGTVISWFGPKGGGEL